MLLGFELEARRSKRMMGRWRVNGVAAEICQSNARKQALHEVVTEAQSR